MNENPRRLLSSKSSPTWWKRRACPGLRAGVLSEFDRIIRRTADGVLGAMETMYQRSRIQEESRGASEAPRTDAMSDHRSARRGARKGGYHPAADRRATKYGRTRVAHPQGCGPAAVALDRGPSWHPHYETLKHEGANLPAGGRYPIIGVNTFLSSKGSPTILPKEVIRATEEEKEAQIATVENLRAAYSEEAAKAIKDLQQAAIRNENMFEVLMEATKYCSLGQLTAAMFEVGGQYRRNM